jgi:hypothetical protein
MEVVVPPGAHVAGWEWRRVAVRFLAVAVVCCAVFGAVRGGAWRERVLKEASVGDRDVTRSPATSEARRETVVPASPEPRRGENGTSLCRPRVAGEDGFAIVSYLMHEHDYVDNFVSYHARLGFHRFFFLVDNIDGSRQQPYVIDAQLAACVDLTVVVAADIVGMQSHPLPRSRELNVLVNAKLLPRITEDWVLAIGIDSFLWLDGLSLNEHFRKYPQIKARDCSEIFFPWIIATNVYDANLPDPLHRSDCLALSVPHSHASPMARRDRITGLADHSHQFEMKALTVNMFSCGVVTENMPAGLHVLEIFKIVLKSYDPNKGALIHMVLRNYDEVALKGFFSWTKEAARALNRDAVRSLVGGGPLSAEHRKALGSRLLFLDSVSTAASSRFRIDMAKVPPTTHPVRRNATQRLVDAMLRECSLSKDEYVKWKKTTREAYIKKLGSAIPPCEL